MKRTFPYCPALRSLAALPAANPNRQPDGPSKESTVRRASLLTMLTGISFLLMIQIDHTQAQYVHPGGLHTKADLDRMKTEVAAGAHPWIDDWNLLIADPWAQSTYTAASPPNMGSNRQRPDQDAHAAYLLAIRRHISGNTPYA